jgi:hypothetical protein
MSHLLLAAHGASVVAFKIPEPKASFTVPIIVVFALLTALAVLRKLISLALLALVIAIGFVAYQSGAFNHWVDKGKQVIQQH